MIPTTEKRALADVFSLKGKVALITGGAKGIGQGIAFRLAEAGADVAVVDLDEAAAVATVKQVQAMGRTARFIGADLARAEDARAAVKSTVSAFGRLDVAVNNAGVFPMKPALELDEATWDRTVDINLKGAFFVAQAAAQAMKDGGAIVNIASIDAFHPTGNLAHYDASKGGLVMLTRSLAVEWATKNIRVNGIAPGGIKTPGAEQTMKAMTDGADVAAVLAAFSQSVPLGRMGIPDDIALATLFLACDASF
jgi:2-deoxy-D-gluconate 3-dehydrogenase